MIYNSQQFYEYIDKYIAELQLLTDDDKKDIGKISYTFGYHTPPLKRYMGRRRKYKISEIVDWFFDNYKDPAVSTTSRNVTYLRSVEMSHRLGYLPDFLVLNIC